MDEGELALKRERLIESLVEAGVLKTPRIVEAFRKVPRHLFVAKDYTDYAYDDTALPIMKESTISQPYTVAMMLEALQPDDGDVVMEIGTGSGWQACLIAHIVSERGKVVTIEIDMDVAEFGRKNVEKLKPNNIELVHGDGSVGYEKGGPYDKIVYTAGTPKIPDIVFKQLKVGGRMVAPLGSAFAQAMYVIDKVSEDKYEQRKLGDFLFVKLRGKYGWQ